MDGWFDQVEYGELLKDLRLKRPNRKRQEDVVDACRELGLTITMRSYGKVERGERIARVDEHMAFGVVLMADPDYFYRAVRMPS